ncbi:MAG: hypothetical protein V4706_02915 [Pseudomonadota bacterium]
MPFLLKPLRPNVKDALTGEDMPEKGVTREILIPPDHYAERTEDISITEIKPPPAAGDGAGSAAARLPGTKEQK